MRSRCLVHAALLALLTIASPGGWLASPVKPAAPPPERSAGLGFDDLFDEERTGARPTATTWSPGGDALFYLWDDGQGEALWRMDAATGAARRLLAAAELPAAEGDEPEIDAYHPAPVGEAIAVESGGDLFLWHPASGRGGGEGGELVRLTATEAAEEDPRFSPEGGALAFVREADLYLIDLATLPRGGDPAAATRRLTTGGVPGETLNATTSWVYWEEIWNRDPEAYWWSPDGRRIAYYQFDETPVGSFPIQADPAPVYPEVEPQRYPTAGTANPSVRIGVLDLASGETVWLDTASAAGGETYLARVHWTADSRAVAVERLDREQTELDLLLCDPARGPCRAVLTETHPTWVNLGRETTLLPDGGLIWASERSGWRHLYLYRLPQGEVGEAELVRPLTAGASRVAGDWAVTSLDHAGTDALVVTALAPGELGAARRRILRVPLAAGGEIEELAGGGGWHGATVAPGGRWWLHDWSSAGDPGWTRIERLAAGSPAEVQAGTEAGTGAGLELPSRPPAYDPAALPAWRIFTIPGPDGVRLPAAILLPPGVVSGAVAPRGSTPGAPGAPGAAARHPVLMYHYGCPSSQVVADRWGSRARELWHRMMAERGYVVLAVDNQTSLFFGKAGADRAYRDFGPWNLQAQLAGVEYLRTLPYVDPARIGIWGWSGGGSNTLGALLGSPGTWRAGVAGAPVTDWRYYDTIWTERYLDQPDDNPEGYRASSPVTGAGELADRLLIIHGTGDDNVHPQNTLAFAGALVEAGLPFEMAIYPRQKHGFRDAAERHLYERLTEFFDRTLTEDDDDGD